MLQDYFGYFGYNKYIASLGCRTTMSAYQRWGYVSAADSAKEWIQMYKYIYSGKYKDFIRKGLAGSTASNFRIGLNGKYTVYSKCGWTDELHHDTAVVEAEHPYVLICFTNRVSPYRLQEVARALMRSTMKCGHTTEGKASLYRAAHLLIKAEEANAVQSTQTT